MSDTLTPPTAARTAHDDELRQLARVRADLEHEFADRLTAADVARQFDETVASFDGAPIRSFVPVLAQRSVRSRLREVAGRT
jgi:hypothetical protein